MRTQPSDTSTESQIPKCAGGFVSSDLKAYLDKELSPFRTWYVARHLSRCNACHEEVVWLQRLGKNMRLLESAHPRPELRSRILSTLPQMEMSSTPLVVNIPSRRKAALRYSFAGAFSLLIFTVVFAALRSRSVEHNVQLANTEHTNNVFPNSNTGVPHNSASKGGSSQEVALPAPAIAPDPTSERANDIYAAEMKNEKEQAARRLPDDWKRAFATVRASTAHNKQASPPYIQVAMDVRSVAAAQAHLISWANTTNTSVKVLPADAAAHRSVSVVFNVLPGGSTVLLGQLKRVGEISALTSAGVSSPSQWTVRPMTAIPGHPIPTPESVARNDSPQPALPMRSGIPASGIKPPISQTPETGAIMVVVILNPAI